MSKFLLRTRLVIEECEQHLEETESFGTSIEAYLTQHILVVMCAEIQQELFKIVEKKSLSLPPEFQEFITNTQKKIFRSVQKSEIAGFIGTFGHTAKDMFNSLIDDNDVRIYGNAVTERHNIAHEHGSLITFSEAKGAFEAAQRILNCAETSLGSLIEESK